MNRLVLYAISICLGFASANVSACEDDSDCNVGGRTYRIYLPEGPLEGTIVFAHGYRGSAKGVMRNKSLLGVADDLGVALIALNARGHDWHIDGAPSQSIVFGTDDFAYVENVLDHAIDRFGLDHKRVLAIGFSAGGMLVWNLACRLSHRFAGFAPISGTFWRPIPPSCPAEPASILHFHGTRDPVVPLRGRPIADTHQGDVHEAMAMYARTGGFVETSGRIVGELDCRRFRNDRRQRLELCLFDGGHAFSSEFVRIAWRELMVGR